MLSRSRGGCGYSARHSRLLYSPLPPLQQPSHPKLSSLMTANLFELPCHLELPYPMSFGASVRYFLWRLKWARYFIGQAVVEWAEGLLKERRNQAPHLHRTKQGLNGYTNGSHVAAVADTGAVENVMSLSYARAMGLNIEGSSSTFELGNSRKIKSIGRSRPWNRQRKILADLPARCCVCSLGFCPKPKAQKRLSLYSVISFRAAHTI